VLADGAPGVFRLLTQAIHDGVPFDGIGIQAHEPHTMRFPLRQVQTILDRYATLGKELRITEFTPASGGDPITESHVEGVWDEAAQADYAVKFYRVTVARTRSNGVIVTWYGPSKCLSDSAAALGLTTPMKNARRQETKPAGFFLVVPAVLEGVVRLPTRSRPLFSQRGHRVHGTPSPRMQRHPVALAVEDHGPEAVRSDLVLGLEHLAAVRLDRGNGLVETALSVQIDEHAVVGRFLVVLREEAAADAAVGAGQDRDHHPRRLLLLNLSPQDGGVEADRPVQIQHWNIHPDDLIGHELAPSRENGVRSSRSHTATA